MKMHINWDPIAEHQAGVLCEKGFMKEIYDERVDELVRSFTDKGIDVVKEILKDPQYQKAFMEILFNEIKDLPKFSQAGIVNELRGMLHGGNQK